MSVDFSIPRASFLLAGFRARSFACACFGLAWILFTGGPVQETLFQTLMNVLGRDHEITLQMRKHPFWGEGIRIQVRDRNLDQEEIIAEKFIDCDAFRIFKVPEILLASEITACSEVVKNQLETPTK